MKMVSSMTIIYGDILNSKQIIIHQVNCQGVMGAGLAKQIRDQHPAVYQHYKNLCSKYKPEQLLGHAFIVDNIISVFGQLTYGYNKDVVYTDYKAIARAFKSIDSKLPKDQAVALPYAIGCGLANGDIKTVHTIIKGCFTNREVFLYIKEKEQDF